MLSIVKDASALAASSPSIYARKTTPRNSRNPQTWRESTANANTDAKTLTQFTTKWINEILAAN